MSPFEPNSWNLTASIAAFAICASVIGIVGTRLTATVDRLADWTGIGEAIAGAVLLGASTSLSGSVLSVSAALNDRPELAMSNALGGIAVQTAFLSIADVMYRRANLEHAAASAANMMQAALLACLLSILLVATYAPDVTVWKIHVATPVLLVTYGYGLTLVRRARTEPMWQPEKTNETTRDEPGEEQGGRRLYLLLAEFGFLVIVMGVAGWWLEHAAAQISSLTNLAQALMGVLFTSVSTSLPELVTSVAAVRRGALTLAVGGIIGGNAFDTLFAAFSDIAYRRGSIYHALPDSILFWTAVTLLMTTVLLMGLIRREKRGIAMIGFESFVNLLLYGSALVLLIFF